ncbi:MAG: type II secretion system inner membrane protein GspF [Candidatus Aureabacteria bacterium]|nr:type II secretion system inner membrane protein GspF [Candidatus Auribacterota bacterium]
MGMFNYNAMDSKGKEIHGTLEASNVNDAIAKLRDKGLFPTKVTQQDAKKPVMGAPQQGKKSFMQMELSFLGGGVKSKSLAMFTRQLATLIDAGLPLLRCLNVLKSQEKNATLKRTVSELSDMVEGGSTFSEALAHYPKIFSKLFVNMVKAGEAGGVLELVLNRVADFMEKSEKLKAKVKSAMIYPAFVIIVALGVLAFLMAFIVPKFGDMFKDLKLELPPVTQFLINASDFCINNWYYPIITVVLIVVLIKLLAKTKKGKLTMDSLKLNMPIFGSLVRKVAIARFTRTLGTLITSGVPILQALSIVKDTVGNEVISTAVESVHDSIREGESIVEPLRQSKVFPPVVVSMIDVGEETGELAEMLIKIADNYDEDVDNAVAGLTSLLEPVLIVSLAVIVGFIVIALFLPLIALIQKLSG